jgi:hypothetical protein
MKKHCIVLTQCTSVYSGVLISPYPDQEETSSKACQGRARYQQHRDANCHQVVVPPPPLQGKAPKEIDAILTETLACFPPVRAKDLSAPLYVSYASLNGADYFRTQLWHVGICIGHCVLWEVGTEVL